MKKGQISLDLLLTLIVATLAISSIGIIILEYKNTNENSLVYEQLSQISGKTASFLTATQALADTNFHIELKINKIKYTTYDGKNIIDYPNIQISNNMLTASIMIPAKDENKTIKSDNSFSVYNSSTIIDTTKVKTEGILVVQNE